MNKETKSRWFITIFIGLMIGLSLLVILKNSLNPMSDRLLIKLKSELKAIKYAIEKYNSNYGHYPQQSDNKELNFGEQLATQMPSKDLTESREMFIDYFEHKIKVSNDNYAAPNADPTTLLDPWGEPYYYTFSEDEFIIWSAGPDKINSNTEGDDISLVSIKRPDKN